MQPKVKLLRVHEILNNIQPKFQDQHQTNLRLRVQYTSETLQASSDSQVLWKSGAIAGQARLMEIKNLDAQGEAPLCHDSGMQDDFATFV